MGHSEVIKGDPTLTYVLGNVFLGMHFLLENEFSLSRKWSDDDLFIEKGDPIESFEEAIDFLLAGVKHNFSLCYVVILDFPCLLY